MLELKDITAAYRQKTIFQGISATFEKGSTTALLGRNGTGKSTLLRIIAGLKECHKGKVLIDGKDIGKIRIEEKARLISCVTTEKPKVQYMSCKDIVALGRAPYTGWTGKTTQEDERIITQAMLTTDTLQYAGRPVDTLSDGELQRVMIARALAQDTTIMLLDEPTAFLDLPNRYAAAALLERIAKEKNKTVIFSTHDLDIAMKTCDEIAVLTPSGLYKIPAHETTEAELANMLFAGTDMQHGK